MAHTKTEILAHTPALAHYESAESQGHDSASLGASVLDVVSVLEQTTSSDNEHEPHDDVDPQTIAALERIVDTYSADRGQQAAIVQSLALMFSGVYFPARSTLHESTGAERVKKIATTNAFVHTFSEVLRLTPAHQRAHLIQSMREKLGIDLMKDEQSPEIAALQMMETGARYELKSFEMMQRIVAEHPGVFNDVAPASIDEDVKQGFDLKLIAQDGRICYFDIKSANPYQKMVDAGSVEPIRTIKKVIGDDGVATHEYGDPLAGIGIKTHKAVTRDGNTQPIIVLDVQSWGDERKNTRSWTFSDERAFKFAVASAVRFVRFRDTVAPQTA